MIAEIFMIVNTLVFLFWLLMIFAPYANGTRQIFNHVAFWIGGGLVYVVMILFYGSAIDWMKISMPTYDGITTLMAQPEVAAIAWIHLILFDLFAGRWILFDLDRTKDPKFIHIPFLFLTLMAGPFGLASYLLYRKISKKKNLIIPK